MKHLLIRDEQLNGWEYGMLRAFEDAIVQVTGAEVCLIPEYKFAKKLLPHVGHGMNKSFIRDYLPKQPFTVEGDVLWYILMGPENYRLDLHTGWDKKGTTNVLYLFDTLPSQYPIIKKLFSGKEWDICITAFNDAVDDLEKLTGHKWYCMEQAADASLFTGAAFSEKLIHFTSYGRRFPDFHKALLAFCSANGLYYDYTTHDGRHPTADSIELYKQYAWHLNHSLFTISWPVELTNPARAGHLSPITCRWFEGAASGAIIAGKAPANPAFSNWLHADLVAPLNPLGTEKEMLKQLDSLWDNRVALFEKSRRIQETNKERWSWKNRVNRILDSLPC